MVKAYNSSPCISEIVGIYIVFFGKLNLVKFYQQLIIDDTLQVFSCYFIHRMLSEISKMLLSSFEVFQIQKSVKERLDDRF